MGGGGDQLSDNRSDIELSKLMLGFKILNFAFTVIHIFHAIFLKTGIRSCNIAFLACISKVRCTHSTQKLCKVEFILYLICMVWAVYHDIWFLKQLFTGIQVTDNI